MTRRAVAMDGEGRVAESFACRGCGYDLRGLTSDAACPECSRPVGGSIRGDELRFCQAAWLRRLALGASIMLIGLVSSVAGGIALGIALELAGAGRGALVGVAMGLAAIVAVGAWLLTTPEPGRDREGRCTSRRIARWCLVAQLPGQLVSLWIGAGSGAPISMTVSTALLVATELAIDATFVVGTVAGLVYLGALADRIPRPRVRRQLRIVAWGLGISSSVCLAMVTAVTVSLSGSAIGDLFEFLMFVGSVASIGLAVFGLWGLALFGMVGSTIGRIGREAIGGP